MKKTIVLLSFLVVFSCLGKPDNIDNNNYSQRKITRDAKIEKPISVYVKEWSKATGDFAAKGAKTVKSVTYDKLKPLKSLDPVHAKQSSKKF